MFKITQQQNNKILHNVTLTHLITDYCLLIILNIIISGTAFAHPEEITQLTPEERIWLAAPPDKAKNTEHALRRTNDNSFILSKTLLFIIACGLVISSLLFLWNFQLRKEINKRVETEKQLIKAKQEAEQANKAKSIFLANMSHELRSPMNVVLGFTTLLQKNNDRSKSDEYLNNIQVAGKSLLQLIDNILDLSRIEASKVDLHMHKMNIRNLFTELKKFNEYFASEKGLVISFGVDNSVPETLIMDEIRLHQVLRNLISNAMKFTDQGVIHVYASATKTNGDTCLKIEVKDTGIGIRKDQQEHIFGTFNQQQQQDPVKYKGSGLGLAISKKLVSMMGGEIHLQSQEGKGSTFTVIFPRVQQA